MRTLKPRSASVKYVLDQENRGIARAASSEAAEKAPAQAVACAGEDADDTAATAGRRHVPEKFRI